MKVKAKTYLTFILLLCCLLSFGQQSEYKYKRELSGITENWHKIILPNEIFQRVSPGLSDLRIIGITSNNDTLEAPYLLKVVTDKITFGEIQYQLINQSKNEAGYYYTFEIPGNVIVNQTDLEFKKENFDWKVTIEGSQEQKEWFTITEDYRILSIKNQLTDYKFTKIAFPNSQYRFLRFFIQSNTEPELVRAALREQKISEGSYRDYRINETRIEGEKNNKQTQIELGLPFWIPVSYLKVDVKDAFDYYRPVTIRFLTDSVETANGWKYIFSKPIHGTLSSLENNEFKFNNTITNRLQIIIYNQDNEALQLGSFVVKGNVYELTTRFTEPASYSLVYGSIDARKPTYDIGNFEDKIPEDLIPLTLSVELAINRIEEAGKSPLFRNKSWLWTIMTVIIVLLGWFSIKMIRKS